MSTFGSRAAFGVRMFHGNFHSTRLALLADRIRSSVLIIAIIPLLLLAACGGGSQQSSVSAAPPPVKYTIGGTVSGLTGTGLMLQDNGSDNLGVSANGAFTFATAIATGASYSVSVMTQPSGPTQTCTVTNGSGKIGSVSITNIVVDCSGGGGTGTHNEWTWMAGSSVRNQSGVYGTKGTPAASNIPGTRSGSSTWVDATGNFWLFGGGGSDSTGTMGAMNDLWMFSAGQWTWMSGSNLANQPGNYGTQGIPAASNFPGARGGAASGINNAGNLWLFGGFGADSAGGGNPLNDLWEYGAGEWTWVSGSSVHSQKGVYGTKGVANPSNVPGARFEEKMWIDTSGDLWIFGGTGFDSTGANGPLSDLWKYSAGEWTWMGGPNTISQPAVFGTQGTAAPSNWPGAGSPGASWTDAAGNLWLFGGGGSADLWMYSSGEWTWMSGSNLPNQPANYGTQGVGTATNTPGARTPAAVWLDAAGDLWLFGGSFGGGASQFWLNDLWKYRGGEWTWVNGPNTTDQPGVYGTIGVPSASNVPGARSQSAAWIDQSGDLWLFGGTPFTYGNLNDLWEYQP